MAVKSEIIKERGESPSGLGEKSPIKVTEVLKEQNRWRTRNKAKLLIRPTFIICAINKSRL